MTRAERTAETVRALEAFGQLRRRPRSGQLPRPGSSRALERDYARRLRAIVDVVKGEVDRLLMPEVTLLLQSLNAEREIRQDVGEGTRALGIFDRIRERVRELFDRRAFLNTLINLGRSVSTISRESLEKQLKRGLGIAVPTGDDAVGSILDSFVTANVSLVTSVPQRLLDNLEGVVLRAFQSGTNVRDLTRQISNQFSVGDRRARTIARDQMGKLSGQLTRARQESIGVTEYVWRTVNDGRVRASHRARNGQTFRWDRPPPDGMPGEAINCRCWAEPVLDQILGAV